MLRIYCAFRNPAAMPSCPGAPGWYGVVLVRAIPGGPIGPEGVEVLVQHDKKRGRWELPKGGMESTHYRDEPPYSSGTVDRNAFQTARWELWEEAGWWINWRSCHEYFWLAQGKNAWLVTMNKPCDVIDLTDKSNWRERRKWIKCNEANNWIDRDDHTRLLNGNWHDGHDIRALASLSHAMQGKTWIDPSNTGPSPLGCQQR